MRIDARTNFHFGVNFILAPAPLFTNATFIGFQSALAKPERGLAFDQAIRKEDGGGFQLIRQKSPFHVTVQSVGPGVSQLLIIAPNPAQTMDDFVSEAECVCDAFLESWPAEKTLIHRDGALRRLYPMGADTHAFQYLWEKRLHQADNAIQIFQRAILGGGIRLVFPPLPEIDDDAMFEVKIESFLQDPSKLFVETTAAWNKPMPPGSMPEPKAVMDAIAEFADGPVEQFILMEE